jgi:hypothetical protein
LASIGSENSPQPLPYRRLLAAYRLMQQQIDLDEALNLCEASQHQRPYFEALLRQVQAGNKEKVDIPTPQLQGEDLWFGIQLLCDAHCPQRMFGLLHAWQTIEQDDKPWLLCSRLIIERSQCAKGHFERMVLGEALEEIIRALPKNQYKLKNAIQATLIDKLWLPNGDGAKALPASEDLILKNPTLENRLLNLRATIRCGNLEEGLKLGEKLLIDIIDKKNSNDAINHNSTHDATNCQEYIFNINGATTTLKTVNQILIKKGLKPFLISGSLLGLMRDGKIMDHDKDLDMGLIGWESQFDLAQALLEAGHFDFDLNRLNGNKTYLISAVDQRTNISIDFFIFHEKGDHFLHGIDYDYGFTQNFKFSKFNLTQKEFFNDDFYIPENWTKMLNENYGEWTTPQHSYVVTVESPALINQGSIKHKIIAQLEMLKTILNGLKPQRAQRILDVGRTAQPNLLSPQLMNKIQSWIDAQVHTA